MIAFFTLGDFFVLTLSFLKVLQSGAALGYALSKKR